MDHRHKQGSRGGEEKKVNFTTLTVAAAVSHRTETTAQLRFYCREITNRAYFYGSVFCALTLIIKPSFFSIRFLTK